MPEYFDTVSAVDPHASTSGLLRFGVNPATGADVGVPRALSPRRRNTLVMSKDPSTRVRALARMTADLVGAKERVVVFDTTGELTQQLLHIVRTERPEDAHLVRLMDPGDAIGPVLNPLEMDPDIAGCIVKKLLTDAGAALPHEVEVGVAVAHALALLNVRLAAEGADHRMTLRELALCATDHTFRARVMRVMPYSDLIALCEEEQLDFRGESLADLNEAFAPLSDALSIFRGSAGELMARRSTHADPSNIMPHGQVTILRCPQNCDPSVKTMTQLPYLELLLELISPDLTGARPAIEQRSVLVCDDASWMEQELVLKMLRDKIYQRATLLIGMPELGESDLISLALHTPTFIAAKPSNVRRQKCVGRIAFDEDERSVAERWEAAKPGQVAACWPDGSELVNPADRAPARQMIDLPPLAPRATHEDEAVFRVDHPSPVDHPLAAILSLLAGLEPLQAVRVKEMLVGGEMMEWLKLPYLDSYHCEDGPALHNLETGEQIWYRYGQYHRADGPALTRGQKKVWVLYGQIHRMDGPAIVDARDSTVEWWAHGKRVDGDSDGTRLRNEWERAAAAYERRWKPSVRPLRIRV